MSNLETAAILSQKVYDDLERIDPSIPVTFGLNGRYEVLQTSLEMNPSITSGYYGAIILDTETNTTWLASRGTEINPVDYNDFANNWNILWGDLPESQFNDARTFLNNFNSSQSGHPNVTVATGQSLGGHLTQTVGIVEDLEVIVFDSPGAQTALNNLEGLGFTSQVSNYDYTKITVRNVGGDLVGGYGAQLTGATVNVINVDDILSQTPNGRSGLLFVAMSDALQSALPNNLFGMLLIAGIEVNEEATQRLLYHNMENHTYTLATDYAKTTELQTSVKFLYAQDDSLRVDIYDKVSVVETSGGENATFYLGSDNGLYGIIENPDGTSSFYYRYGNDENEFVSKTFNGLDDMSSLTLQEQYIAQEIVYQKYLAERKAAEDLLQNNPDIANDPEYNDLPQGVKDQIDDLLVQGQAVENEDALSGQVIDGDFGNDELGGGIGGDTLGVGAENFNVSQLVWTVQNGEKNDQIKAALQLYTKIKTDGVFDSATGDYTLGNAAIENVTNSYGGNAVKISYGGVTQGYITLYEQGSFQQRVVETVGPDGRTNSAEIMLGDSLVNQLYRGEAIEISYPDDFVFGLTGGIVGNIVGQQLSNGELARDIIVSGISRTLGSNIGEVLDFLSTGQNTLSEAAFDPIFGVNGSNPTMPRPDILDDFLLNLQASVVSVISAKIVDELGDSIGLDDGLGREVFDVSAGAITTGVTSELFGFLFNGLDAGVYSGLASNGFNFSQPYPPNTEGITGTYGDYIQGQVASALAGYVGSRLAGEIIAPDSEIAAIFGSVGSAVALSVPIAGQTISAALTTTFAAAGSFAPIIGTAIGAFIGTAVGTVFGNLFGGNEDIPEAWARGIYDPVDREYQLNVSWDNDGGDVTIAQNMLNQVMSGVNTVLSLTHGTLRENSQAIDIQIGYEGSEYRVSVPGADERSFNTSVGAINYAVFKLMKSFDMVGGHAVLMRAWHNSDATNIYDFKEDLEVAEAFQVYLTNPAGILALMMDQPESELAQSWAAILQRAAELELHLPHEKDLDGGWGEVLRAQGLDPELVPELEGDKIILTDPTTGEETVLHHIIGPGYEIVRIEGTDGNDIIEVIVDGPSITYVAAGAGDDSITGSEQADIIVGGVGDDVINGLGGNDWLHGGLGEDTIDGGDGEDFVIGSEGADYLVGGADNDKIYGNDGNDTIYGGSSGNDVLYGGAGDDYLQGNGKSIFFDPNQVTNTYLYGGEGNDTLLGLNHDQLDGGVGNDTYKTTEWGYGNRYVIHRDHGHDVIETSFREYNTLTFANAIDVDELYFTQDGTDLKIYVLGLDQSVTVKDFYASSNVPLIKIQALGGKVEAGDRASILQAVANDSTISETPVGQYNIISDSALASATSDYESGSVWADTPLGGGSVGWGSDASSTVYSGANWVTMGGAGNDLIESNMINGSQDFYGGSGNDVIKGYENEDNIVGGLGNDFLYGFSDRDRLWGGDGDDFLSGGTGDDVLRGEQGADQLFGNDGDDNLDGGAGDDYLEDFSGNNTLRGGAGDDTITAENGTGNNKIYGDSGADIITGGAAFDTIFGGSEDDIIDGGAGDDWIDGEAGNDDLLGGDGNDVVSGGLGDDVLRNGNGNDTFYGGVGNDTFVYSSIEAGAVDSFDGGEGVDTFRLNLTSAELATPNLKGDILRYQTFLAGNQVQQAYTQVAFTLIALGLTVSNAEAFELYVDGVLQNLIYNNIQGDAANNNLAGTADYDYITGNDGDDVIDGGAADDDVRGGSGSDTLSGGEGRDIVAGGEGDDILSGNNDDDDVYGEAGNDTLFGDAGNDNLSGGAGNDTVSYVNAAMSVVSDLTEQKTTDDGDGGEDKLQSIENLIGSSYDDVLLGNLEVNHIQGGAGADSLYGFGGDDILHGDAGADSLFGSVGNDILNGGSGSDEFIFENILALDGIDTIQDFNLSEGDKIRLDRLLTFDSSMDVITDFVQITDDGINSYLAIDQDGGADNFIQIAEIQNVIGLTDEASLVLNGSLVIVEHNEAPIAQNDNLAVELNKSITGNLLIDNGNGVDSDPENDPLVVTPGVFTTSQGGMAFVSVNGDFTYMPLIDFTGSDSFQYNVNDDSGAYSSGAVNLTVSEPAISSNNLSFSLNPVEVSTLPDNTAINSIGSYYNAKTMGFAFETGADISARQVIYEQGGGTNGLAVYVESGSLYVDLWNYNQNTVRWQKEISTNIDANTKYTASFVYDGTAGTVTGYLDGTMFGQETGLNILAGSARDIGIGQMVDQSRFHNTNYYGGGFVFTGSIEKIAQYNAVLSGAELDNLHDYMVSGWTDGYDGNIAGSSLDDNLSGTVGDDTIWGFDGADALYGAGGSDVLLGGAGADDFIFDAATAFGAVDTIKDFSQGEDALDISDILDGFYDPLTDAIANFVSISSSEGHTTVSVDQDGSAGSASIFTAIAVVENTTWSSVEEMLSSGDLKV